MKYSLLLIFVVLMSSAFALTIQGDGDTFDEVPINKKISWESFFQESRSRFFLDDQITAYLEVEKPYELVYRNKTYFLKLSSLTMASAGIEFYSMDETLLLFEREPQDVEIDGFIVSFELKKTEGLSVEVLIKEKEKIEITPETRRNRTVQEPVEEIVEETAPVVNITENISTNTTKKSFEFKLPKYFFLYILGLLVIVGIIISILNSKKEKGPPIF